MGTLDYVQGFGKSTLEQPNTHEIRQLSDNVSSILRR